jgi:transcriptional regulator with XRE-family HTH domain
MEITGNHIKAARALADLDQEGLAKLSEVSINTIRNMEARGGEPVGGFASTREKVQGALEKIGIEFMNGGSPGVRLVKVKKRR